MKSKLLLASLTTLIGLGILTTNVSAQSQGQANGPMSSVVQAIADKFGLDQTEVQTVFDQVHNQMRQQRQADFQNRLDDLVSQGQVTESQKQLILEKHEEMAATRQSEFESFKDLTPSERRTAMETRRQELQTWATDNGINLDYLMLGHGKGPGMGSRHFDE